MAPTCAPVDDDPGPCICAVKVRLFRGNCRPHWRAAGENRGRNPWRCSPSAPIFPSSRSFSSCNRRRYPARSTLIHAGDACDTLYYIIKGSVTVLIEDDQGREIIVAYLNTGDFFGELGLFDQQDRSAWVRTKTSARSPKSATPASASWSSASRIFCSRSAQLAKRLRDTTRKVGDLAFLDVTGRVARTLLDLCKQPDAMTHPDGMQIKITRQEIGRIVGCSREMVGRVLKTLEDQELISAHGKTMVIFGAR